MQQGKRGVVMQQRERRRLFPTRSGLVGLVILVAMFIASMNYSNTLAYVLCFFILSVMVVSSVYTQYNLH